jgi:hypothetical protein
MTSHELTVVFKLFKNLYLLEKDVHFEYSINIVWMIVFRIRSGFLQSKSTRVIGFEGRNQQIRFDLSQTIQYSACKYETLDPKKRVTKLRSLRNYIIYDDPEQVVQFLIKNMWNL